jgi:hypothetical protein
MNESPSTEGKRNCTESYVFRKRKETRSPRTTKNDDCLPEQNILLLLQEERGRETLRARERMLSVIAFLWDETRIREKKSETREIADRVAE